MKKFLILLFVILGLSTATAQGPVTGGPLKIGSGSSTIAGTLQVTGGITGTPYDTQTSGNVFKFIDEYELINPHQVDGTGAVVDTLSTSPSYGQAIFAANTDEATNYVLYRFRVPFDLDTNVDLQACFSFRLGAADTGTHTYKISMADVADSASADSPSFSNTITWSFGGDASGASGDTETVGYTTLTSWKSSLTPGHIIVIKLARDGDAAGDSSSQASSTQSLSLKYGRSQ